MNDKLDNEHVRSEELFCLTDINVKSEEYEKEISILPYISSNYCVNIRKKKIEPAGFMFYIKYEIPILKEKKKKIRDNKNVHTDELFLYKDKLNYLNDLEDNNNNKSEHLKTEEDEKKKKKKNDNDYDDTKDYNKRQEKANYKKSSNLVKKCIDENINVYEILGVDETDDLEAIKASYKKLILIFHPDKNKGTAYLNAKEKKKKKEKEKEKNKESDMKNNDTKDLMYYMEKFNIDKLTPEEKKLMFLKIQDSYTILSDKTLRKQYDSSIPFDEYIPTQKELEEASNFYDFLRPVFKRNAKWSSKKPVPDIGDENTNIKNVKYFYDFWYNFVNWRDFSYHNAYDYEQAECREERRWMERENKKIQKKVSKLENLRILKLVDLAYNNDPRIIAENKRIKTEKQKKKELAILEKQKKMDKLNDTEKDNTITNNSNEKTNKEKAAMKIWKHHIKSVCMTKLPNTVNYDILQEKLLIMPFETLCDFIYDIYVLLNFNFYKSDTLPFEKMSSNKFNNSQEIQKDTLNNLGRNNINNKINGNISIDMQNENKNDNKNLNHLKKKDVEYAFVNKNNVISSKNTTTNNSSNINISIVENNQEQVNETFKVNYDIKSNELNGCDDRFTSNLIDSNKLKVNNENKNEKIKDYNLTNDEEIAKNTECKNDALKEKNMYENSHLKINDSKKNNSKNYKNKKNIGNNNSNNDNNNNSNNNNNKNTGFIGHLKSIELGENDIESLINIFKKYINDTTFIIEKKEEVNSKNLNINNNLKNDISAEVHKSPNNIRQCDEKEKKNAEEKKTNENTSNIEKNAENEEKNDKWTAHEVSLLAKALKFYPGGTKNRWVLISNSIKTKSVKEVIKKTKEMFENETLKNLSRNFDESPFDHFKNQNKGVMKKIDDNLDKRELKIEKETNLNNNINGDISQKRPWTQEEQYLLEKALVKYPASIPIKERLELVSSELKTRTVDEVILRMKKLRAQILAKKSAK
ncbi:DNA-binding chaperone, putative [Plasmodium relictum]|uniref:DNA-binding chaperone, putative n=1 Tax=Plasmodium relictum TaxID=85471 RepID=A0A1J1HFG2_PLARL|nr:DNA-binding chaperone, putative [Plasmodium relictum]CRH02597.1 DNA-binding chaperone, putative [Plasmodium relictum]